MKTVDTCIDLPYSPLIPALKAIFAASEGEKLQIIMNNDSAFSDLKKFLAEQGIGFREIYEKDTMVLQFIKLSK